MFQQLEALVVQNATVETTHLRPKEHNNSLQIKPNPLGYLKEWKTFK